MEGPQALAIIEGTSLNPPVLHRKAGRPTRAEVNAMQRVKARLERDIAKHSRKVVKTYVALAAGEVLQTEKGEVKLLVDPPTTRHFIDKFIPPARPEIGPGEALLLAGAGMILADYLANRGKPPQPVVLQPISEIIETTSSE